MSAKMDTRDTDAMEPKAPKAPSCSAREYAARFMPTVNYHDSKACKAQARRAAHVQIRQVEHF
mgnify:CR=1 FL=1